MLRRYKLALLRTVLGIVGTVVLANALGGMFHLRWMTSLLRDDLFVLNHYGRLEGPVDVVFIGSSHTQWGTQATEVEAALEERLGRDVLAWNLGMPAGSAFAAPVIVDELLHGDLKPKVLVLEADPMYWTEKRISFVWAEQYWRHFAPLSDVIGTFREVPWSHTAAGLKRMIWALETIWQVPARFISKNPREKWKRLPLLHGSQRIEGPRYRGEGPKPESPALEDQLLDPSPKFYLANPTIGERSKRHLQQVADLCRERGITLVLLNYPIMQVTMDMNEPGAYEEFLSWMYSESERLGFLLRDENRPANRDRQYFYDVDHLEPYAARQLSRRIAEEVLAPLLADE